jgi:hypothetical protein
MTPRKEKKEHMRQSEPWVRRLNQKHCPGFEDPRRNPPPPLLLGEGLGSLLNITCPEKQQFFFAFSALSSPCQVLNVLNASLHGLIENFTLMQSIT